MTKRIGRVYLSLLAADRAMRCAEVADDPLRLGAAHWNLSQVLLADGEPKAAEAVAMKAAERLQPFMAGGTADMAAMYGSVILVRAVAAARTGDAWTARERVRLAAPLARRTGERNTQWTAFGPTNVAMYAVSIEFESGEAAQEVCTMAHHPAATVPASTSLMARLEGVARRTKGATCRAAMCLGQTAATRLGATEHEEVAMRAGQPAAGRRINRPLAYPC